MRILAVFTRNPYSRATGRKAVLKTIVRTLTDLGHQLDLVIYDMDRSNAPDDVRIFWRSPLGLGRTVANVIWRSFLGPLSLNESAYFSPSELRFLRELANVNQYGLVVADMLRTAPLAAATDRPLLIDMDDLLSERYTGYLSGDGSMNKLLGYYGERLPSWFSRVLLRIARPALAWEAKRLRKRELYWVGRAAAVALVSDLEAKKLSQKTHKRVLSLPMAVDIQEDRWCADAKFVRDGVFVGGMDYQPNVEAVEWYQKEVEPHTKVKLDVLGACPDATSLRLSSEGVRFVGYVDDLYESLRASRMFVAPIVSGSGIKTKVLEALAVGIPVIATSSALTGIGLVDGEHCLIADTGRDFARAMERVMDAPQEARDRAARARDLLTQNYSSAAAAARWDEAIRYTLENHHQT